MLTRLSAFRKSLKWSLLCQVTCFWPWDNILLFLKRLPTWRRDLKVWRGRSTSYSLSWRRFCIKREKPRRKHSWKNRGSLTLTYHDRFGVKSFVLLGHVAEIGVASTRTSALVDLRMSSLLQWSDDHCSSVPTRDRRRTHGISARGHDTSAEQISETHAASPASGARKWLSWVRLLHCAKRKTTENTSECMPFCFVAGYFWARNVTSISKVGSKGWSLEQQAFVSPLSQANKLPLSEVGLVGLTVNQQIDFSGHKTTTEPFASTACPGQRHGVFALLRRQL